MPTNRYALGLYLNCSWEPARDRARRKTRLDVPLFVVPQSPLPSLPPLVPSLPRQLSRLPPSAETAETPPPALLTTGAGRRLLFRTGSEKPSYHGFRLALGSAPQRLLQLGSEIQLPLVVVGLLP